MNRLGAWSGRLTIWGVALGIIAWMLIGAWSLAYGHWSSLLVWLFVTLALTAWLGFVLFWSERRRGDQ